MRGACSIIVAFSARLYGSHAGKRKTLPAALGESDAAAEATQLLVMLE